MDLLLKRRLKSRLEDPEVLDPYSYKESELKYLNNKPTCFIMLGKPGAGCSTLGKLFATEFQCEYINPKDLILSHLEANTDKGKEMKLILEDGGSINEEIIIELIKQKMESPEVAHRGYILDGFPSANCTDLSITDQFDIVNSFKLQPDFVIYMKIPNEDLEKRLATFRLDPSDGNIYFKQNYDPDFPPEIEMPPQMIQKKEKNEGDEEEEEEEERDDEEMMEEGEEFNRANPDFDLLDPETIKRLLKRPEDFKENVTEKVNNYIEKAAMKINDYIDNFNSLNVINLNANIAPIKNFKQLMERLRYYPSVKPACVPQELYYVAGTGGGGEDEDEPDFPGEEVEPPDDTGDFDELFREISNRLPPCPGYRWQRSKWLNYCPVALYQGILLPGKAKFAVGFLNKVYLLSTEERMKLFVRNPRPFLLPEMPQLPCKIAVVGPPGWGKTTVCHLIANRYDARVIDMEQLIIPHQQEAKKKFMQESLERAQVDCIDQVKQKIKKKIELEKSEIMGDKAMDKLTEDVTDAVEVDMKEKLIIENSDEKDEERSFADTIQGNSIEEEIVKDLPEKLPNAEVSLDHPEVQELITKAMEEAEKQILPVPLDVYIEELERAIIEADQRTRDNNPNSKQHGRWILDNFPVTKDQWTAMLESEPEKNVIPDQVIVLKDESENMQFSLQLWYKNNKEVIDNEIKERLGEAYIEDTPTADNSEAVKPEESLLPQPGPELSNAKKLTEDWFKDWNNNAGIITGAAVPVEIIEIDIANKSIDQLNDYVQNKLTSKFEPVAWEVQANDLDELEEDEAAAAEAVEEEEQEPEGEEGEEEEENEEEEPKRSLKKPLGDISYWDPVYLKNQNILYTGNPEIAVKYMNKMYYFGNEENRDAFLENPRKFIDGVSPPKAPPLRIFFLGAKGSGKTTHGRNLAEKMGLFHISFHEILQEFILPKNLKKIGGEYLEDEPVPDFILPDPALEELDVKPNATEDEVNEEAIDEAGAALEKPAEPTGKEEEMEEAQDLWDENENAIKDYLENRTPLTPELLSQLLLDFWNKEPFNNKGFVLEGFPKTSDEAQFVEENALFVDCAVILKTSEDDVVDRLLKPRMARWKERRMKKDLYKQKMADYKAKKKQLKIDKRRKEILKELEEKRMAKINALKEKPIKPKTEEDDEEEAEEEEEEDDILEEEVNIEDMLNEEFGEEEEEEEEDEEEETEEDAEERIRSEIMDIYGQDTEDMDGVIEKLQELQIPRLEVQAGAKMPIVRYRLNKKLKKILDKRESIFERCNPVTPQVADKLLRSGYFQSSFLGRWCPVKNYESPIDRPTPEKHYPFMPQVDEQHPTFPVIYRNHIYFCSSKKAREDFMVNPLYYLKRPPIKDAIPIKLCILGMPKSGKTTLSDRFVREYGVKRITGGEAVRHVLNNLWYTELAREIKSYLHKGLVVPHELVVSCIDVLLMDTKCSTIGYVLEGYPITFEQCQMLNCLSIIPYRVVELLGSPYDLIPRANKDRLANRELLPFPMHDSPKIMAVKLANYDAGINDLREWYGVEHDNIRTVDCIKGKWLIWDDVNNNVKQQIINFQDYLYNRNNDRAAKIYDLCIRPNEFKARLSPLQQYCPIRLFRYNELQNTEEELSLRYAAEYAGHYYKMCGEEELLDFLDNAEEILAGHNLQLPQDLPLKIHPDKITDLFPMQLYLQGYCPVCFLRGKCRYEGLVLGSKDRFLVEYQGKLFVFCSDNCMQEFMKTPTKYCNLELPKKVPPIKVPLNIKTLPLPGYLEQTMADALRNALTATGTLKPKHPFINPSRSALLYIALHLKAYNPKSPEHLRKKYKRKLEQFELNCDLIKYLSEHMTLKYKEIEQRPAAFDDKLNRFLNLRNLKDDEDRWINM